MEMILGGTGHRPNKLHHQYSDEGLKILMNLAISEIKAHSPDVVMSGLALGWDTALALAAVKLKLPLIAAVPFPGQERSWKESDRVRYSKILSYAESTQKQGGGVYYVTKSVLTKQDIRKALLRRNVWMVDHAQVILALWDGSPGGTGHCVQQVEKVIQNGGNIKLIHLWEKYLEIINNLKS